MRRTRSSYHLHITISMVASCLLIAMSFGICGIWYEATRPFDYGRHGWMIDEELFLPPLEPFVKPTLEGNPDFLRATPVKYGKRITTLVRTTGAYDGGGLKVNYYCYYGVCNTSRHCSHPGRFVK